MVITVLIILPLIAIIDLILTNRMKNKLLDKKGLVWSLIILIYISLLILIYNDHWNFQFCNSFQWFENITNNLNWGYLIFSVDGISLFFIYLSIILIPISILISLNSIITFKKEFLMILFFILFLLIGVFTTLDLIIFYVLFETILIPMFILIGIWGSREEKIKASFYFFFYTLIGSFFMLVCIFKIYSITGTTNYQNLMFINLPINLQYWLFIGFFASLSVKIPMIPFHIWLPQAHVEAPISGSVLLAGILLKLGGYGFLRFSYSLFPIPSEYFSPVIMILSIIALIFGALTTCRQTDIKRLIAYSSVSHMGLVTISIFSHSIEGIMASITMMIAHGLVSSGLFMTSSVIYSRHHSRAIKYFRGLTITMPIFSTITIILILANIGFPPTFNFIAELLSIMSGFNFSIIVGLFSCVGALVSTVYALFLYNRVYFGSLSKHLYYSRDLLKFEFNSFIPLILLTIILGLLPNIITHLITLSSLTNISLS